VRAFEAAWSHASAHLGETHHRTCEVARLLAMESRAGGETLF